MWTHVFRKYLCETQGESFKQKNSQKSRDTVPLSDVLVISIPWICSVAVVDAAPGWGLLIVVIGLGGLVGVAHLITCLERATPTWRIVNATIDLLWLIFLLLYSSPVSDSSPLILSHLWFILLFFSPRLPFFLLLISPVSPFSFSYSFPSPLYPPLIILFSY